jgi:CO/xanthine dehydrogenase FAD-binding subunit
LGEAVEALAAHGGRVLSGGTDFFPALGDKPLREPVIDISGLHELSHVSVAPDAVRIGARVTWSTLVSSPLPRVFDALKAAAREVGSIQIQNAGTVAGNICNASPAADGVPPLLALDAMVELRSSTGERLLPLESFITGYRATALQPRELVTAIVVPRSIEGHSAFLKLGARRYLVISIAMVAAIIESDRNGRVSQARIAVGACSAVAQRLRALEETLVGTPIHPGLGERVGREHLASLMPIDDVRATAEYRRDAALTLVRRALDSCVSEA